MHLVRLLCSTNQRRRHPRSTNAPLAGGWVGVGFTGACFQSAAGLLSFSKPEARQPRSIVYTTTRTSTPPAPGPLRTLYADTVRCCPAMLPCWPCHTRRPTAPHTPGTRTALEFESLPEARAAAAAAAAAETAMAEEDGSLRRRLASTAAALAFLAAILASFAAMKSWVQKGTELRARDRTD